MSFSLRILDVLHGDSIVIATSRGGVGLVDCCRKNQTIPALDYLRENFVSEIDFICLTHPHQDHYSGMLELLEYCSQHSINIKRFYDCGLSLKEIKLQFYPPESADYYRRLLEWIYNPPQHIDMRLRNCSADTVLFDDDDLRVKAVAPDAKLTRRLLKKQVLKPQKTLNDYLNTFSVVLLLEDSQSRALLLADSDVPSQKTILSQSKLKAGIDLFKVSHHGSKNSFCKQLYKKFKKDECAGAISTGCCWDIPIDYVVRELKGLGISVYSTNCRSHDKELQSSDSTESTISQDLLDAMDNLTLPAPEKGTPAPYHGWIQCDFSKGSFRITTEMDRPSL